MNANAIFTTEEQSRLESFRQAHLKDGHPVLPEKMLQNIRKATGGYAHWGRSFDLNEMHIQTARNIFQFVVDLAVVCLALEDKKGAQESLELGFYTLTNCVYIGDRQACCCTFAESLGYWAENCGLPKVAKIFGQGTYCPQSPQYHAVTPSPAYGVRSVGEEIPEEIIAERTNARVVAVLQRLQ